MGNKAAPLGKPNDTARTCSRLLRYADDGSEVLCGEPAVRHIIYWWDSSPGRTEGAYDHGFACASHWAEFQKHWSCAGSHELDGICGMPGSRVHVTRCYFDDLPVEEPVRAVAAAVEPVAAGPSSRSEAEAIPQNTFSGERGG